MQFLFYFGYLVTAGTIAGWYFAPRNKKGRKILLTAPTLRSCGRTLRYHVGTVAFGSLIIAIFQTIRAIVLYTASLTKDENDENFLKKLCNACLFCCLKCVQCCLDKVNKHAFIWTAIWGDSFLVASCSSFALIWRNLARVAALNVVSHFLFILGKIMVALMATGLVGIVMEKQEPWASAVYSPILPLLAMFIISYAIASLFMLVFAATVDTIFICFLVDEETHERGEMLAPESLRKLVDKYDARSKKNALTAKLLNPVRAKSDQLEMK
jgi:choline transporter-like protein 2/4/5